MSGKANPHSFNRVEKATVIALGIILIVLLAAPFSLLLLVGWTIQHLFHRPSPVAPSYKDYAAEAI